MRSYETAVREANASDQNARANSRKSIEDSLVDGGMPAINDYVAILDKRKEKARSLAEYDGLGMGYDIADRARKRVMAINGAEEVFGK
jgi:hypothetical protein